jgi:hypothetical protein
MLIDVRYPLRDGLQTPYKERVGKPNTVNVQCAVLGLPKGEKSAQVLECESSSPSLNPIE